MLQGWMVECMDGWLNVWVDGRMGRHSVKRMDG